MSHGQLTEHNSNNNLFKQLQQRQSTNLIDRDTGRNLGEADNVREQNGNSLVVLRVWNISRFQSLCHLLSHNPKHKQHINPKQPRHSTKALDQCLQSKQPEQ